MSNRVLIDVMNQNNHDAGTKARDDVMHILERMGFETTVMFNRNHNNLLRTLEVFGALAKMGGNIHRGELIVLQYPYQPRLMKLILNRLDRVRSKTGCKLVIMIHDVLYLRNESAIAGSVEAVKQLEVGFFNAVDAVIVHNPAMREALAAAGVRTKIVTLGIFDYLYEGSAATVSRTDYPVVVFAGNLSREKSGFIYQYNAGGRVRFNLYGTKPENIAPCFSYKGSFPPDELIANLEGNYGLVWDGPSADTCEGNFGNYLRFNDPHKFSLYIAAGLPVVVWKESALAGFVRERGLGVLIGALSELDALPGWDSEAYRGYVENVRKLRQQIRSGTMLQNAIQEINMDK